MAEVDEHVLLAQAGEQQQQLLPALLVEPRDAKRIRGVAEEHGIFDGSRRIGPYHGGEEGRQLLAVPVVLDGDQRLPAALQGCAVVHDANLPPSTAAQSRHRRPHVAIAAALERLLLAATPSDTSDTSDAHEAALAGRDAGASSQSASQGDQCHLPPSRERIQQLLSGIPRRWEEHEDLMLLPAGSFDEPEWLQLGERVWRAIVEAVPRFRRIAIQERVDPNPMRTSRARLVLGASPIVTHVDNGIRYTYDITRLMFSRGNITEKLRVASFPCNGQVVVDLFSGIGYFTLPYLVHAGAAKVVACEWNPEAVAMLKRNLRDNKVASRCEVLEGDNRFFPYSGIADRVNLGLIPTSRGSWPVAVKALRKDKGGWLHIHENVSFSNGNRKQAHADFAANIERDIQRLLEQSVETPQQQQQQQQEQQQQQQEQQQEQQQQQQEQQQEQQQQEASSSSSSSLPWSVHVRHIECVKSYAPKIDHVVFDVECRPPCSFSAATQDTAAS